jgi:hypothetical protein
VLAADSQALYLASGHLLYTQQGMLLRQPFDPERRQTSGAAETVAERIAMDTTGAAGFSATGDVLVYRTGTFAVTTQLQWADRNGRMLGAVGPPGRHRNPALSPDDTRVAVETLAPGATTHDIWVIEVARGAASRLTLDPADDTLPRWLPDGRRIVFRSTRGGRPGLYLKAADGTGGDTLIASGPADGTAPPLTGWSPTRDGQGVVVTRGEPEPGIAVLPLEGGMLEPVERTTLTRVLPEVSPDGRWLLYNSNESGRWEVYVQGYRNGAPRQQISTDGGVRPRWDKVGREVFYMAPGGRLMAVPIAGAEDLSVGNPLFLFEPGTLLDEGVSPNYFQQFDLARDGRILLNVPLEPVSAAIAVVVNWAQPDADTR